MKRKVNIRIVEDELMIAEMTREMLLDLKYSVVGIAKDHDAAIDYLAKSEDIDLVILDINLGREKTGIDIAEVIQDQYEIPFIYLTSYSDPKTIKKAAQTSPAAYLLKPFIKSDLYTTIEIIIARNLKSEGTILIKDGDLNVKLKTRDIHYIMSDNNYLEVFTLRKKYIVRNSLDVFLEELSDSNFIRIHRSYAANILKIEAVNGQYVLVGEAKLPLSRTHKQEVIDLFMSR
mgnify:FL=1